MTATHQLEIAVMSMAYVGRSLLLTTLSPYSVKPFHLGGGNVFIDLLRVSLSNALLGMDANDPPKTLATMQLISSIFSNVSTQSPNIQADMAHMPPTAVGFFNNSSANLLLTAVGFFR
jgi:proteasome activator subunit 4